MYLLIFDIIDSRTKKFDVNLVFNKSYYQEKYQINSNLIEVTGGDQLRLLSNKPDHLLEIIISTLTHLSNYDLKSRVYVTTGELASFNKTDSISTLQGDIFYRAKELELVSKQLSLASDNAIYYSGGPRTAELRLVFASFSKLVLKHSRYIKALDMYVYEQMTQSQIAHKLNLSQSTVNNQLAKSNINMYKDFDTVIRKLIEEELC